MAPCGQRCASQVGGAVASWSGHVDSGFAELLLSEVSLWEAGLKNQGRFSLQTVTGKESM